MGLGPTLDTIPTQKGFLMQFRFTAYFLSATALMLNGFAEMQSTPPVQVGPQAPIQPTIHPCPTTGPTAINPASAGIDYDIVAVAFDRDPNAVIMANDEDFPDASNHSLHIARGARLIIIHPDGSTDCLVNPVTLNDPFGLTNFPNGACVDPTVSFDGTFVLFSHFEDPQNFGFHDQISDSPANIFKVDIATKVVTQLTFESEVDFEDTANRIDPQYAQFNVAPIELADGRILFLSNRDGIVGANLPLPAMRFFRMNADGSNVEALENFTLGNCQHPYILRDGRIVWTHSHGTGRRFMANGNYPLMVANPDMSDFKSFAGMHTKDSAWHFTTQLSSTYDASKKVWIDGDVATTAYYHQNNWGHGAIIRFPLAPENPNTGNPSDNHFTPLHAPEIGDPALTYNKYGDDFHLQQSPAYHVQGNNHFDRIGELVTTPWAFKDNVWEDLGSPGIPNISNTEGKATMPSGVPGGHMLLSFSKGKVNSKQGPEYGPPHMEIAFMEDSMAPTPGDMTIVFTDENTHYAYPKAIVPYIDIHGIEKPILIPDTNNDGTALPADLPAGSPFATMGTSSLYNRESAWPSTYTDSWGGNVGGNYAEYMAIFHVGQDHRPFKNKNIFAAQVVVDMSHVDSRLLTSDTPNFKSHNNGDQIWAILGEVAVRKQGLQALDANGDPDTSYEVRVPADVPMHNRIIDARGITLTGEATWHAPRPGERKVNCGGCHAHSFEKAPLDFSITMAASMPVQDFALETPKLTRNAVTNKLEFVSDPEKFEVIEFNEDVQQIFDSNCVICHDDGVQGPKEGNLQLRQTASYNVYDHLAYDSFSEPTRLYPTSRLHQATRWVRRTSAAQSLLVWVAYNQRLDGRTNGDRPMDLDYDLVTQNAHQGVNLSFDDKRTIASWVDLGCLVNLSDGEAGDPVLWDAWDDQMRPTLVVQGFDTANLTIPTGSITVSAYDLHSGLDENSWSVEAVSSGNITYPASVPSGTTDGVVATVDLTALATLASGRWTITVSVADNAIPGDGSPGTTNPHGNISRRVFTVNL